MRGEHVGMGQYCGMSPRAKRVAARALAAPRSCRAEATQEPALPSRGFAARRSGHREHGHVVDVAVLDRDPFDQPREPGPCGDRLPPARKADPWQRLARTPARASGDATSSPRGGCAGSTITRPAGEIRDALCGSATGQQTAARKTLSDLTAAQGSTSGRLSK